MENVNIESLISVLEAKKDYIADRLPVNDVSNGKMTVLGEIIEYLTFLKRDM